MKHPILSTLIAITMVFVSIHTEAQKSCLDTASLLAMDIAWETALRDNDVVKLESMLAEDFTWVHNHVSSVDSKASLIARAKDPAVGATGNPISRTSHDVRVLILGSTAVVTGFTTVTREKSTPHYNFMRTYAEVDGKCLLLANHTMQLNEKE